MRPRLREWILRAWGTIAKPNNEVEEELRFHLEMAEEEALRRGASVRHARLQAGGLAQAADEARDQRAIRGLTDFLRDIRLSLRSAAKHPQFTAVAVVSLALGIGANAAVFSVIQAVLLRPLPYPQPQRLLRVGQPEGLEAISLFQFQFWRDNGSMFASAAGFTGGGDVNLTYGSEQQWIKGLSVSKDFFRTLGVVPSTGREFTSEENSRYGPKAIILTDALWRNAFGGDPAAIGRIARINNGTYTVVGILPASFWFSPHADVFLPMQPTGTVMDNGTNTEMIARLKPGLTMAQARAQLPVIGQAYRREHPDLPDNFPATLAIAPLQDFLAGDVRINLLLLFAAVVLLLLIACFNLAGLMLARLSAQRKEFAIRLALGGGRGQLFRQLLLENLLVTAAGAIAGVAGANALIRATIALAPFQLRVDGPVAVDSPVLAFCCAVALLTALGMSALPIAAAGRVDVQAALKSGGRAGVPGMREQTRGALVVGQVALSATMLFSAGLLIETLYRLYSEQLGFRTAGLTTVETTIPTERRRTGPDLWRYEQQMVVRLRAIPGVHAVEAINKLPLAGRVNFPTEREGHPENSIGGMEIRAVTPAYFDIMGIPVLRGRAFGGADDNTAPAVAVVNETLGRRWWGNGNPLDDRVLIGRYQGKNLQGTPVPRVVVGMVADTKTAFLKEPPEPTVYIPAAQDADFTSSPVWILRVTAGPGFAGELRRAITSVDPQQGVGEIRTMEAVVASTTADSRFNAWLFASLAGLALVLTVVGIYGLLSFSVARRTNEIGTRMALGASHGSVLVLVLRQGLGLIVGGLLLGLAGSLAIARWIGTLLFGVKPTDPLSFAAVSALLIAAGLLASYLPAHRATRIDPMTALRDE